MALTRFHNITGSTGVDIELLAPGDSVSEIKSIVICNTRASNDATISLFLQSQTLNQTFHILKTVNLPFNSSIVLESKDLPAFNNNRNQFGLYMTVGSSDTLDVLLNV
tara:strand:- start:290 stop:613 length:324 start_codon:yes stop_codon:yes gene_type:complete